MLEWSEVLSTNALDLRLETPFAFCPHKHILFRNFQWTHIARKVSSLTNYNQNMFRDIVYIMLHITHSTSPFCFAFMRASRRSRHQTRNIKVWRRRGAAVLAILALNNVNAAVFVRFCIDPCRAHHGTMHNKPINIPRAVCKRTKLWCQCGDMAIWSILYYWVMLFENVFFI